MNLDEFLKEIDPDAGWYLPSTVYEYSGSLRDRRYQCPLCSVANKKFWEDGLEFPKFINTQAMQAAVYMGLSREDGDLLIAAADDREFTVLGLLGAEIYNLRMKLLQATRLKETT